MAQPRMPRVQWLVQKGYVKEDDVQEATKVGGQTGQQDIVKVLVQLGKVGEREALQAQAQEMGVAFVDLDRQQIESSAINVLREQIAKNHNVIPVKKEGSNLWVAMSDVNNIPAQDAVRLASG